MTDTDKEIAKNLRSDANWLSDAYTHVKHGTQEWCEMLMQHTSAEMGNAADRIETLSASETVLEKQNAEMEQLISELSAENKRLREALEIKPLEWSDELIASPFPYQIWSDNGGSGAPDDPFIKFNNYRVFEPILMSSVGSNNDGLYEFKTLKDAKKAAQDHYEEMIRAALKGE